MEQAARRDYLLAEARRADPERYLCALLAPAERREPLLAVIVLGAELGRVPQAATQPMAALIRYQWWREAIAEAAAGRPRAHPVIEGLGGGLAAAWLRADELEALVDAHESQLDAGPAGDADTLAARLEWTSGGLQEIIARCLGPVSADERAAARKVGTALALVRAAGHGHGAAPHPDAVLERAEALLAEARRLAPRPDRAVLGAFLPARLARARSSRLRRGRGEGQPPWAVLDLLLASARGRY